MHACSTNHVANRWSLFPASPDIASLKRCLIARAHSGISDENEKPLPFPTCITARLRPGQSERLVEKLLAICAHGAHLLPGTAVRSIGRDPRCPDEAQVVLIWRAALMAPKEEREAALAALRVDLAEIVVWETARSVEGQVIIHA